MSSSFSSPRVTFEASSVAQGPLRGHCARSRTGLRLAFSRVMSTALEVRVLGPLEVVHYGVARRIGSPIQRTLLSLLSLHPNELVSTDRIVDVLWFDDPAEGRRKLWFHVSKLRGILQPEGSEHAAAALETLPTGYALRLDPDGLDAA